MFRTFKVSNPHRQLSEEETRVYAAGMAAARRNQKDPEGELPPELYRIWRMGWNRIGKRIHNQLTSQLRSNHNSLAQTPHMVRTEVATLDEALQVIDKRNRSKKSSETMRARADWRQELIGYNLFKRHSPYSKKKARDLIEHQEAVSEAEELLVAQIKRAVEVLKIAVEESSVLAVMRPRYPGLNQHMLIDVISKLVHMIGEDLPDFAVQRKAGQKSERTCRACGTLLLASEVDYCVGCKPVNSAVQAASKWREEIETETKLLGQFIRKVERKAAQYDDDGEFYRGHPREDAGNLEVAGQEGDYVLGSAPSHQPGEGDLGEFEGGDRGGAPGADQDSISVGDSIADERNGSE